MRWILMAGEVPAALVSASGWFTAVSRAIAPAAVAAIWQGAAIAFVLGLCLRLTPRIHIHIGAAQRFAIWAGAFALIAGLPLLPRFARGTAVAADAPLSAVTPRAWLEFNERWALVIAALWLAASLVRAVRLAVQALRLRRILKAAKPVTAGAKFRELLAGGSSLRRTVELCTTSELDRPCVIGFLAPRILIPDWLYERLTPGELEHVVLHEAEHLRRSDDWTNLLQKLALVLFPLNPALAWIEGRLCREREMACDEGVVRSTQAPREYAACLTSVAERRLDLRLERRRAHALSLGALDRRPELVRRVYSILARKQALHPVASRALVGVAACGLVIASVELARCPQMVAFVPTVRSATLETQVAQSTVTAPQSGGDRVYAQSTEARGDSGLRVVDTKAYLPSGHGNALPVRASSHRVVLPSVEPEEGAQRQFASADPAAPREVLLRSEIPNGDTASGTQPEYVVLTTWEEVRTSPRNAGLVSDYETGVTVQPRAGDSPRPANEKRAVQITVTRLIFAIYLTNAGAADAQPVSPATGTKPTHVEDSGRPPAPQPESGWLVLQL